MSNASSKAEIQLQSFFIFNPTYGAKEGEEGKKILYYHPITDNIDMQIKNVGLVEGIIQFTSTFKPSYPVNSLHTQKLRQIYFQPERDFWMVVTLNIPSALKNKDGANQLEHVQEDVQDNVYEAVLKQAYYMFRLFSGSFEHNLEIDNIAVFKTKLEYFYRAYLMSLKLNHCDILNIFCGIQYLPLDKLTFLKVQCFINALECNYSQIQYSAFLYNDHLIWSGLEPDDMKIVYQYLIGTLLPANMDIELQGGSMPRNASSPFGAMHHGRFITGPTNLKSGPIGKVPKVFLYSSGKTITCYLIVFRVLSASICLFVKSDFEPTMEFFKDLYDFMNPKLIAIVSDISEYCSKQVLTPSNVPENAPRFIYFNKMNLAYKSTVHIDNKRTGNITCSKESMRMMADLNARRDKCDVSCETIVKTMNDCWVIAKNSNLREFYIALQHKTANLIDISEEVKKLCDTELKGIFFHSV